MRAVNHSCKSSAVHQALFHHNADYIITHLVEGDFTVSHFLRAALPCLPKELLMIFIKQGHAQLVGHIFSRLGCPLQVKTEDIRHAHQ